MNTEIVNITPHAVAIIHGDGNRTEIPASGQVARVSVSTTDAGTANGVPLRVPTFGKVADLPDPKADTLYIVSALVRTALPDRGDLASPADLVRDEDGNIVGCRAFDVNKPTAEAPPLPADGVTVEYELRDRIVDCDTYEVISGLGRVRSIVRFRGWEDGYEAYTSPRLAFCRYGDGPVMPGNEWAVSAEQRIQQALRLLNFAWDAGERCGGILNDIAEVYALGRL